MQIRLSGDELIITLGNKQKNLVLPEFLEDYRIREYAYEQPELLSFLLKMLTSLGVLLIIQVKLIGSMDCGSIACCSIV